METGFIANNYLLNQIEVQGQNMRHFLIFCVTAGTTDTISKFSGGHLDQVWSVLPALELLPFSCSHRRPAAWTVEGGQLQSGQNVSNWMRQTYMQVMYLGYKLQGGEDMSLNLSMMRDGMEVSHETHSGTLNSHPSNHKVSITYCMSTIYEWKRIPFNYILTV